MLKKFLALDFWTKLAVIFLISGIFGKVSAYLGLAFGGLMLLSRKVLWDRLYLALTRGTDPMNPLAWALVISMVYGWAQVVYGVLLGYSLFYALQILVFNICPFYLFFGIYVGMRQPQLIRTYIRALAWFTVFYTPTYFLFLKNVHLSLSGILPGTGLEILPSPGSGSTTLLGLLCMEPELARFWIPIVVLACLTIVNQERADWLSLGICLALWAKLTNRVGRVLAMVGCIFAVLAIAAVIDLKLPAIPGRGGELSARGTIARMAGAISPEMAEEVGGGRANAHYYYGTVYWRQHWWAAIREEVGKEPRTIIFGMGYGYPLAQLAGRSVEEEGTRSPHSVFYFALAYSGFVGVAIFFWVIICVISLLWRSYRVTGETYGLTFFLYCLIGSFFGNFLEAPQGGVPLYLICGILLGPMFLRLQTGYQAAPAVPDPVAELV